VRRFWKGDGGVVSELATRLSGSSDLYEQSGRRPYASINFITSHDGFSLHDLVSYNEKHNEANLEDNQDGDDNNLSWNCGAEGPTEDPEISAMRRQQMRNFLTTLFVSQGVPMIRSGDEIAHSQRGNNNAYCQDNEISWIHWEMNPEQLALLEFTRHVIRLWRHHVVLQRRKFFHGRSIRGGDVKDIAWIEPSGKEMSDETWNHHSVRCLGMWLSGTEMDEVDEKGERLVGDSLLILLNAHHENISFRLPSLAAGKFWELLINTAEPGVVKRGTRGGYRYALFARSVCVFRLATKTV
jgi:glycogen operon protein